MLTDIALTALLSRQDLNRRDKVLLVLAHTPNQSQRVIEITDKAVSHGLRIVKKWNISAVLSGAAGLAVRKTECWMLTEKGKAYLEEAGYINRSADPIIIITDLRKALNNIKHQATIDFVEESIECFERGFYRAAVVLSWVGAVSLLYEDVMNNHLARFNTEAVRRDAKWRNASNADDLSRMKEHSFLDILEALSILGKNVKQELQSCLMLRNGCGHPNSLKIGKQKVAAHLEILMLNIFSKY